jgi:serine/threonine protein kinase
MPRLTAGENVRSTYTVERFLGEGAFAEVYRVQHRFLGRQAMKVLKAPGAGSTEIEQMLGEALLLSRIGHPNIIRVFDANVLDIEGETYGFFTMEYVPGGSLDAFWRSYRDRLMPIAQAVDVIKQVCLGVAVAHAESPPIVHRDIKPQNILVGYDANGLRVRVADFGLAKRVNPLTLLVSSRGTLQFKAPESFDNHESPAADVWAIGTTSVPAAGRRAAISGAGWAGCDRRESVLETAAAGQRLQHQRGRRAGLNPLSVPCPKRIRSICQCSRSIERPAEVAPQLWPVTVDDLSKHSPLQGSPWHGRGSRHADSTRNGSQSPRTGEKSSKLDARGGHARGGPQSCTIAS